MSDMLPGAGTTPGGGEGSFDIVIVGAGFAGMYALHELRKRGFSVHLLEKGLGVGGTWYWNRYPGARCDIPSFDYSYAFSDELHQEWEWSERYAAQPEIEAYANFVADKFDLRRDISFGETLVAATWNEAGSDWSIGTDSGRRVTARFLIMAVGGYSVPVEARIPGLDEFAGAVYYTSTWPAETVDFTGKRVGVVGTGASGMQVIEAVAAEPIDELFVFQRTANFVVPGRNRLIRPDETAEYKETFPRRRALSRDTGFGVHWPVAEAAVAEMDESEFQAHMQEAYEMGGPAVLSAVSDLITSETANARVADFFKDKVRQAIADPAVADLLNSPDFHLGARRLLVENGYLAAFNQDNVTLVDIRDAALSLTGTAIHTGGRSFEIDVLILATGFDSGTGAMLAVDVRGEGGRRLRDHWVDGHQTFLGMMSAGFPNMFMLAGPGSPGLRAQGIAIGEQQTEWLGRLLTHMAAHGYHRIEPTTSAEGQWSTHVQEVAGRTFVTKHATQYVGANIPGKPRVYAAYLGGMARYRTICDEVERRGYTDGLVLDWDRDEPPAEPDWSGPDPAAHDVHAI